MTSKGPIESKDGKIVGADLLVTSQEKGTALLEEIARRLIDNQLAKKEMVPRLTSMGISHEAAARLLRLNPEGGEKEKD